MAESFMILLIAIITIVITCFIFALMRIATISDEKEELWRRKKKRK